MLSLTVSRVKHCTNLGHCLVSMSSSPFCHPWLLVSLTSSHPLDFLTSTLKCICLVRITNSSIKNDFGAGLLTQSSIHWLVPSPLLRITRKNSLLTTFAGPLLRWNVGVPWRRCIHSRMVRRPMVGWNHHFYCHIGRYSLQGRFDHRVRSCLFC